ncbi:MAG TPA: FG-GAP-like repeat-containing protein [Symbiobacteriaceae bacterium]|nr:FG-GAP-like repeat-containing protein [Symbiobacteriaceae bacterium]
MDLLELKSQLPKVQDQLLKKPNAVGVAVAEKIARGKPTGQLGLTVLVRKKMDAAALRPDDLIPSTIKGIRTDVVEVGEIVAQSNATLQRPAPAGVSIGHPGVGAGTLGYFLRSEVDSQLYILSNNHIMAAANRGRYGDNILQPGTGDGGQNPRDSVATLFRFPMLEQGATVDCALARVTAAHKVAVAALDGFSDSRSVPGPFGPEHQGGDIAVADINGSGRPDLVVFKLDNPNGENRGYYRVLWDLDSDGKVLPSNWTEWIPVPGWWGAESMGAGIALADISQNGQPDLLIFHIDNPHGENRGYYRIGWDLDGEGHATGGWTEPIPIPEWWGEETRAAGVAMADINGNGQLDLVVFHIDKPHGANRGYYRIGWNLNAKGIPAFWTEAIPIEGWWGYDTQGAGICMSDVNGDGRPELIVVHVDNPDGENSIWYRVGIGLQHDGRPLRWSIPRQVAGWVGRFSQGGGVATTDLNGDGLPDLILFHIDSPIGENAGFYRVANCFAPHEFRWADPLRGAAPAVLNERLWKTGRTTELTSGTVRGLCATVNVSYPETNLGTITLQDQILIQPAISQTGDSGAVAINDQGRISGLLCAGSPNVSVANRIENVLEALRCSDVRMVPGWFGEISQTADVALWDVSGNGRPDMLIYHVDNPEDGGNRGFYRIGWSVDGNGQVTGGWTQPIPIPGWWGKESQRGGIALADLNKNGRPDLIVFNIDNPQGENRGYYRIGWNLDQIGNVTGGWTQPLPIPGWWGHFSEGGSISVADINGNGRPDLILFHIDNPHGEMRGFYRIGWDLDADGNVTGGWTEPTPVPGWWGHDSQGAGIEVINLGGTGLLDLILFHIDNPTSGSRGYYRIGWDVDATGNVTGGWTDPMPIPGWWGVDSHSGGIAMADLSGSGRPDMVVLHVDKPEEVNRACWRVLFDLLPNGQPAGWFIA